MRILDIGSPDSRECLKFYPGATVRSLDILTGWDVMTKGLPEGPWDILFANHFIEHIINPDFFLDECKRIMGPTTYLEIGTPNLAAWFNRLLLPLGYLPHYLEVSTRYDVGKLRVGPEQVPGGHLHVFTTTALIALLLRHQFRITRVWSRAIGYPLPVGLKQVDQFFGRIPTWAAEVRVRVTHP